MAKKKAMKKALVKKMDSHLMGEKKAMNKEVKQDEGMKKMMKKGCK